MELSSLTNLELLRTHASIIEELRQRGVVRTTNNPIADYTEWLVSTKLGMQLTGNSNSGYDATDSAGTRYQIKGRRIPTSQMSATLSTIRNLTNRDFHWLIAVIFEPDFSIRYAAQIPHSLVGEVAVFRAYQNGHILNLRRSILEQEGVRDLTNALSE